MPASGEVLGQVTAGWGPLDGKPAIELGDILKRSAWGNGYGPEAVAAVIRHGLHDVACGRVFRRKTSARSASARRPG